MHYYIVVMLLHLLDNSPTYVLTVSQVVD